MRESDDTTRGPTRASRRALRALLWTFAIVVCAAGLAVFALQRGFLRDTLRASIEDQLEEQLGAEVEIGEIAGRLLPETRLRDVDIRLDGESAIAFDELVVRFDFDDALSGGRIVLRSLELRGLRLRLARAADGSFTIERLGQSPPEAAADDGGGVALLLEHARIINARIELALEPDAPPVELGLDGELASIAWPLDASSLAQARADLALRAGQGEPLRLALADGELRLEGRSIALPARAPSARATFEIDAHAAIADWWDAERDASAAARVRFAGLDPAALLGDERVAGALDGSADLALARRAGETSASIELALDASELAGLRLASGRLRGSASSLGAWRADELALDGPALRLRASGRGDSSTIESLEARLALPMLGALPANWRGERELAGSAELELRARGPLEAPQLDASARVRELAVDGRAFGALRATGTLAPEAGGGGRQRATIALESSLARESTIEITLAGDRIERLQAEALDLDVARAAELAGAPVRARGRAVVALQLAHPDRDPSGAATFTWTDAAIDDLALSGVFASARLDRGEVAFDASLREVGERRVALAASGGFHWPDDGDLARILDVATSHARVEGRGVDVAIIEPLLPSWLRDPAGELDVELEIEGGAPAPSMRGHAELRDAGIEAPLAQQRYAPIDAAFALEGDAIVVEQLTLGLPPELDGEGDARRGFARVEGRVELEALAPRALDLRAELRGLRLSRASLLEGDARGRLALRGPIDALAIEGDVRLENAGARIPDEDDRALREIQVIAASSRDREASEFAETRAREGALAASRVDVRVRVPRDTWVRGRGAELDLEGDVRLTKQPRDALRAVGTASVVRGSIEFQRKRFDVRRGVVRFDGSPDLADPVIDLEGVHRVRDVSVVIQLAGRLSDPPKLVFLGGEPPMSRDEALAYLVFGRPIDELAQAERGNVQSAALSAAASIAASEFGRLIANTGLIDTLDIEIAEDGSAQGLRVGKYVGNRTFVRYGQTFGADGEQDLQIEYRFTRNLSIESQMSTTGEAGADLILRADY